VGGVALGGAGRRLRPPVRPPVRPTGYLLVAVVLTAGVVVAGLQVWGR